MTRAMTTNERRDAKRFDGYMAFCENPIFDLGLHYSIARKSLRGLASKGNEVAVDILDGVNRTVTIDDIAQEVAFAMSEVIDSITLEYSASGYRVAETRASIDFDDDGASHHVYSVVWRYLESMRRKNGTKKRKDKHGKTYYQPIDFIEIHSLTNTVDGASDTVISNADAVAISAYVDYDRLATLEEYKQLWEACTEREREALDRFVNFAKCKDSEHAEALGVKKSRVSMLRKQITMKWQALTCYVGLHADTNVSRETIEWLPAWKKIEMHRQYGKDITTTHGCTIDIDMSKVANYGADCMTYARLHEITHEIPARNLTVKHTKNGVTWYEHLKSVKYWTTAQFDNWEW